MPTIQVPDNQPLDRTGTIHIPAMLVPSFRFNHAISHGIENNILIRTSGGLGDMFCAEPTIRFALERFTDCEISLLTSFPEVFAHLKFKEVFKVGEITDKETEKYFVWNTMLEEEQLHSEFITQLFTHCVDYISITMLRAQLPGKDKSIGVIPDKAALERVEDIAPRVVVHPGRTWQSRTFPKKFWDGVLNALKDSGMIPIIIGAECSEQQGTVGVDNYGCLDLRGKLSVMETVALLQKCPVLLTNDSAPIHMAASGNAWIGFIATARHADHITHWRHGKFGWRMENFGKGNLWDEINICPNNKKGVKLNEIEISKLNSWLPDPTEFADWAIEKHLCTQILR